MMKAAALLFAVMLSVFLLVGLAGAQATRTWVSGVGDDVNPCSRTAPCKTFAGAISKTAAGGIINALDPGGYGTVTITKSITIDGGGTMASVLSSGVNGIVINAADAIVTLRNLDINGAGTTLGTNGVRMLTGGTLHIENTNISNYSGYGIEIAPNASARVSIDRTVVNEAGGGAVYVHPSAGATSVNISNSNFGRGLFGVRGDAGSDIVISRTITHSNSNNGFIAYTAPGAVDFAEMSLDACVASGNGITGVHANGAGATIRIANSMITFNTTGMSTVNGGSIVSFGNNRNSGNTTNGAPTSTVSQQ